MSTLEQEIATYNLRLPELLGQQGKFVLIKRSEVAGTFDSYRDALTAGYQRFQLDAFLVKQITPAECITCLAAPEPRSAMEYHLASLKRWPR